MTNKFFSKEKKNTHNRTKTHQKVKSLKSKRFYFCHVFLKNSLIFLKSVQSFGHHCGPHSFLKLISLHSFPDELIEFDISTPHRLHGSIVAVQSQITSFAITDKSFAKVSYSNSNLSFTINCIHKIFNHNFQ